MVFGVISLQHTALDRVYFLVLADRFYPTCKTVFEQYPITCLPIGKKKKKRKSKMHLDQDIVLKGLTDIPGKEDSKANLN